MPLHALTPAHDQVRTTPVRRGPESLTAGDRTVRLVGPDGDGLLSRVGSTIGAAVVAVEGFWGVDWPRAITVVATRTDEEFRTAAGGGTESQWADIAAVAVADRVDPAHRLAVGQRIVFAPGATAMSDAALRIVLTHELFHYAARADTAMDAPRWLTEGVADFVARPQTPVPADALPVPLTLPADTGLEQPGPGRSLAYDRAWWFARFVADAYGTNTLKDLYLAACGTGHRGVPDAFRDVLNADPADVLARWREWLTR